MTTLIIGLIILLLGSGLFISGNRDGGIVWPVIGIAIILFGIRKRKAENSAREANEKALREAVEEGIREHKVNQDKYLKEIVAICENSIVLFEQLPDKLEIAEELLHQAQFEFSEGAFAPFWDAIEKLAKTLGIFDEMVHNIEKNSSKYINLIKKYEKLPPKFPISKNSVGNLIIGTSTSERMKEIVRKAQRNFQFSTIYEQRKTNQILVAGFTNLAQALDRMTWQITTSINNLADSVGSMTETLNDSHNAIYSRLGDMEEASIKGNAEVVKLQSDLAAREKRALQMLDNIQHHRKPIL